MNRNRFYYFLLLIAAGLASRHYANYLPLWNKLYLGDSFWALMVFFVVGFVFKKKSSQWVMVFVLFFPFPLNLVSYTTGSPISQVWVLMNKDYTKMSIPYIISGVHVIQPKPLFLIS